MKRSVALLWPVLLIFAVGCADGKPFTETAKLYFDAVQNHNTRSAHILFCSNETIDEFEESFDTAFASYEKGKRGGKLESDEYGVALIKALGLGGGTFYELESFDAGEEKARMILNVQTAYGVNPYVDLPEGTVFYMPGSPWGRIEKIELRRGGGFEKKLVSEVDLELRFRRSEKTPSGWCIESIDALENTVDYSDVKKEF